MIVLDEEKCVGCGRCVPFCPEEALRAWGNLEVAADKCTECLACVDECPVGALSAPE